jgi:hypothetical protein
MEDELIRACSMRYGYEVLVGKPEGKRPLKTNSVALSPQANFTD